MGVELMVISHDDTFEPLETMCEQQDAIDVALMLWYEVEHPFFVIRDERTHAIKATLMPFWTTKDTAVLSRYDGTCETIHVPRDPSQCTSLPSPATPPA